MRPNASVSGLIAWLGGTTALTMPPSVGGASPVMTSAPKPSPTNTIVSFNSAWDPSRVILSQSGPRKLSWTPKNAEIWVKNATLFAIEDNGKEWAIAISPSPPLNPSPAQNYLESISLPTGTAEPKGDEANEDATHDHGLSFIQLPHGKRESQTEPQPVHLQFNQDSITINSSEYDARAYEKKLYLAVEWHEKAGREGRSFSTPFALSKQDPGSEAMKNLAGELAKYDSSKPWRYENYIEGSDIGDDPNSLVYPTPGATSTAQSTESPTDGASLATGSSNNATPINQPGGNGRPNTGAIAGIVVGSVIGGLLIIGALCYFLCFRRRAGGKQQRRHIHGDVGYASDSGAAAMMMREKEMPGVNHSPQSAYADDSGRLHNRGGVGQDNDSISYSNTPTYQEERGMVSTVIGAQQQSRDNSLHQNEYNRPQSYAADSAIGVAVSGGAPNPTTERERNGSVGGAVGRASHQTSRPGSEVRSPSRYAHLIEEGMTEDEIRRLEDEERQLDAAIEDAGRHGRPR